MSDEEKGFGKRHFQIKYDLTRKTYLLKDMEDGTGTFIKIAPKWTLKNNSIISFGDIHFATVCPPAIKQPDTNLKDAQPYFCVRSQYIEV